MGLCSMQYGSSISAQDDVVYILKDDYKWTTEVTEKKMIHLQTLSISGLAIGSLISSKLHVNGKRRVLIWAIFLAIAATIFSLIKNFAVIITARFVFGLASGILVSTAPKMVQETVPANLLDSGFGVMTSWCIRFQMMIFIVLG